MKTKVINILPHIPDYEFLKDSPRPAVNWDTPDGNWVGIYRNEIPDKLGKEVLKFTPDLEYEVWQPDFRADKVYSHRFEDGLVHRLFPARKETELHGLKVQKDLSSPSLVNYLQNYGKKNKVVINLNGDLRRIHYSILKNCSQFPILQTFRGTINLPQSLIFKKRLNFLASLSYAQKHLTTKKLIKKVDYVTFQNNLHLGTLRKIYNGPEAKLTSGCDFQFWKKMDKKHCRKELGLPENKTIFLTSSLLIMRKQIDKLLEVLKELDPDHDFLLLISGHGTREYEDYLKEVAGPLMEKDKVRFVGYLTGETMKMHYNASDLFINPSKSEGGPVSAMKALACETPLFCTNIGNVAERLRNSNSGILVGVQDYEEWKAQLKKVLEGEEVKVFDRNKAEELYDWQKIAEGFTHIYQQLASKYYA